jgi:predicted ester cyclase
MHRSHELAPGDQVLRRRHRPSQRPDATVSPLNPGNSRRSCNEVRGRLARRRGRHVNRSTESSHGAKTPIAEDAVSLAADYAEDCVVEGPAIGVLHGRRAVEESFTAIFRAFPDITASSHDNVVSGNQAVLSYVFKATDTGGFLGQGPTYKPITIFATILFRLRGGEIVYERRVYDLSGVILQLASDTQAGLNPHIFTGRRSTAHVRSRSRKLAARIQLALLPNPLCNGETFALAA